MRLQVKMNIGISFVFKNVEISNISFIFLYLIESCGFLFRSIVIGIVAAFKEVYLGDFKTYSRSSTYIYHMSTYILSQQHHPTLLPQKIPKIIKKV